MQCINLHDKIVGYRFNGLMLTSRSILISLVHNTSYTLAKKSIIV